MATLPARHPYHTLRFQASMLSLSDQLCSHCSNTISAFSEGEMKYWRDKETQVESHSVAFIPFHLVEYMVIELASTDVLKTSIGF